MTDFLTNADHWRRRAQLTRALAANAVKDQGRLLKVAEEYDRLAAHAERRSGGGAGPFLRSGKPGRINPLPSKTVGRGGHFRFYRRISCGRGAAMRRQPQMCDL